MTTVSVTVDVDVDLSDFDTEDLIQELESRSVSTDLLDHATPHQQMFRALSMSDNEKALTLLRDYLCDCLGRVI